MSYDINFWKQDSSVKSLPEKVYIRLCDGKMVKGLAKLPVPEILERIKAELPDFESENGSLVSLKDGSIEISWSNQHFRFDLRGHVPLKTKDTLIAIMADFECPLYDPVLDERYELGAAPKPESPQPNLKEYIAALAKELGVEPTPPPTTVTLETTDESAFIDKGWLKDLTRQATECGYKRVGDFFVPEFGACFRCFFGEPNVYVCLYEHPIGINWSEIIVINADDTTENWCSWAPDDIVAPWSTRVVKKCPLLDLHDMMIGGRSKKQPANLSADSFADTFRRMCQRSMKWRASLTN